MLMLKNITVTDIESPVVVHSAKGRKFNMVNRKTYGLALCISGQITYTMNGKKFIGDKNNAVILPQGGTYSLIDNKDGIFPLVNFKCNNFICDEITVIKLQNPNAILKIFEQIRNLDAQSNRLELFSGFYKLLDALLLQNPHKSTILLPIMDYINQNIGNQALSNKDLANLLKISEVYFRKLFAAEYGITPKQYILNLRIQTACKLLIETPLSISSVAEKCGFSSPYHFCRAFKLKMGVTPSGYAAQNKLYHI